MYLFYYFSIRKSNANRTNVQRIIYIDTQDREDISSYLLHSQGQALIFPHQGLRGVGVDIEGNRAYCCDFTPILTFPHQGGRDFGSAIIAILAFTYPYESIKDERVLWDD